jgi:RNA polymerase sigma factor (sigma-70 family)
MVYRFGRRRGLQDADARELVQNVMLGVANGIQRWTPNPERGKFRSWLYRIARNQWITMISRNRLDVGSGRTEELQRLHEQFDPIDLSEDEEQEYRQELFRVAAARVRESCQSKTWDAFWRTAILDEDPTVVGKSLGMTIGAVYIARSRVTFRLRELIQSWEPHDET